MVRSHHGPNQIQLISNLSSLSLSLFRSLNEPVFHVSIVSWARTSKETGIFNRLLELTLPILLGNQSFILNIPTNCSNSSKISRMCLSCNQSQSYVCGLKISESQAPKVKIAVFNDLKLQGNSLRMPENMSVWQCVYYVDKKCEQIFATL